MNTKLPQMLDQDGEIPAELSPLERNLINFLVEIVASVSGSRELRCADPIQCRKYISKKRCSGQIAAWCTDKSDLSPIEWCCLECGEGGIIYDWQGSRFDQKDLRLKREQEHISKGVWINGQRLDEVKMCLQPRPGMDGTLSHLLYPAHRIVVKKYRADAVKLSVPPLLTVELLRRGIITPQDRTVTLRLGDKEPQVCRFSEILYPHSSDGNVELEFSVETS